MARKKIFVSAPADTSPPRGPLFRLTSTVSEGDGGARPRLKYLASDVDSALQTTSEVEVMCDGIDWLQAPPEEAPYRSDHIVVNWPPSSVSDVNLLLAFQSAQNPGDGPDVVSLVVPAQTLVVEEDGQGKRHERVEERITWNAPTTFWPHASGVSCAIGSCLFHFRTSRVLRSTLASSTRSGQGFALTTLEELHAALRERNERLGLVLPPALAGLHEEVRRAQSFPVHTGQEWAALLQTAADGKRLYFFVSHAQGTALRHRRPDSPFWTEVQLTCEEICAGFGLEILQKAASELDLDSGLIWLYVSNLLAPRNAEEWAQNGGWIDLEDVARKTLGGYADNPKDGIERRRKVWHALKYGARAVVSGQRSVPYFDKNTWQWMDTRIETSPWQILSQQKPMQPSLTGEDEIPLRVEIVPSNAWLHLTASSQTAQFLPLGELLGAVSPSRTSGAWARALGMAYIHWCRLNLEAALSGEAPPSREFLMAQFPPRSSDFNELLSGNDPSRAIKYWCDAEDILREIGFLESMPSARKPEKRKGWQGDWKAASPAWKVGATLRVALENLARHKGSERTLPLPTLKAAQSFTVHPVTGHVRISTDEVAEESDASKV